jgi:carbon storage regulator CsrA
MRDCELTANESIIIDDDIVVTVLEVNEEEVRLSLEIPDDSPELRRKIAETLPGGAPREVPNPSRA